VTDLAAFLTARWDEQEARLRRGWYSDTHWKVFETRIMLGTWTVSRQRGISVALNDEIALAGLKLLRELQDEWRRQEAEPLLADLAAKRVVLAEVASWQHALVDGDTWLSCAQAVDEHYGEGRPGSGCADDRRAGGPCDCGLERRREAILRPMASPFSAHPEFKAEWVTA
jgi:hypothetical protein